MLSLAFLRCFRVVHWGRYRGDVRGCNPNQLLALGKLQVLPPLQFADFFSRFGEFDWLVRIIPMFLFSERVGFPVVRESH